MTTAEVANRAATDTPTALGRVAAVIPAAGQAKRFGSGENKIWASLAGTSVLEWTLAAFQAHPEIATIVLVVQGDDVNRVLNLVGAFPKVRITAGGATRAASVRNGLNVLPADTEFVLVHDAARPLITAEVIQRVLAATREVGAAVPGLPLSDTVKRVDSAGRVRVTVPRSVTVEGKTLVGLTTVQTPQGARLALLRAAYAAFDFARAEVTDESSLLEALGAPVAVVPGDASNIKITGQEDIARAERLLFTRTEAESEWRSASAISQESVTQESASSPAAVKTQWTPHDSVVESSREQQAREQQARSGEIRTGFGYDVHAFAPLTSGRRLFLGGVEIPNSQGLEGHSDADVLLHAVCDALLGAASLGDIGVLFPNTDVAYQGISSLRLLAKVAEELAASGWRIVNIDVTVLAEAPKLMPYRLAMQQAMADCLGLERSRLSIKATTSEKMGFVGRGEGIACWAIATLCAF